MKDSWSLAVFELQMDTEGAPKGKKYTNVLPWERGGRKLALQPNDCVKAGRESASPCKYMGKKGKNLFQDKLVFTKKPVLFFK